MTTFLITYRFGLPNGREQVFALEFYKATGLLAGSPHTALPLTSPLTSEAGTGGTSPAESPAKRQPTSPAKPAIAAAATSQGTAPTTPPDWAALKFNQCKNCPLSPETEYCPSALHLAGVMGGFADVISYDNVQVTVDTEERSISARLSAQQGLASLIGLIMATSGCPSTAVFRPMARFHLPFSSEVETAYRSASMYLMAQQFIIDDGGTPDLHMAGLERIYRGVHEVNRGMAQRLRAASRQDAIVNAVVLLDVLTNLVPAAIGELLAEIRPAFEPLLGSIRKAQR